MDISILGIDVAARKLDLVWSHTGGAEHTTIEYTTKALTLYLKSHSTISPEQCVVGLESTGDYHIKAGQFFLARGFTVKLINPLLTRYYTRLTIRGTKTDKTDAALICKLIADGQGEALSAQSLANRDRELLRLSGTLIKVAVQLTLRLQSTRRKAVGHTRGYERKLERIIARLRRLADEVVEEATANPSPAEQLIASIPGFGAKLSAMVYHELGDIHRFTNGKSLVAYAGLDPRIKQSGKLLNTTGHLTKRGSSTLRHALFLAANIARRFDPELKAYFEKKRTEGRTYTEVLCIISRKLLYRVYAVLTRGTPYVRRAAEEKENPREGSRGLSAKALEGFSGQHSNNRRTHNRRRREGAQPDKASPRPRPASQKSAQGGA